MFWLDVRGVHRVCSLYEAFELVVWWHLECLSRLWVIGGWTLVAFTAFVVYMGRWGWTFVVFYSVCSVYGAPGLDFCGVLQCL